MNIYLGEKYETFVRDQVATGRYTNAAEVIRDGLRQLETGGRGFDRLWGLVSDEVQIEEVSGDQENTR